MPHVPRDLVMQSLRTMADLLQDLAEEVLSRLPMTNLKSVRLTCKTWNTLTQHSSFTTKHFARQAKLAAAKDEFMLVLMMDYKILLVSVYLTVDEDADAFMREVGALLNLDGSEQIDICEVFHCNGLLLCISDDNTRLLVWNPYLGQSRWINPIHNSDRLNWYMYALGYDNSTNSHKILSFVDYTILNHINYDAPPTAVTFAEYSIYDFNSRSWTVLDDVTLDWILDFDRHVSIKGNTYWFAKNKASRGDEEECCLLCFDFTREIFGAPLPFPPFVWDTSSTVALCSVREEQLAVLFQRLGTLMEIWVTTKIEPDTVLWSSKVFLDVNIADFQCPFSHLSFFIDEEKKVAVVFGKDKEGLMDHTSNAAYIVGVDGSSGIKWQLTSLYKYCYPRVCSYVPSLVRLN